MSARTTRSPTQGATRSREWLATPARFARIQNEPVVRLLGAEYAERGVLLKSLEALGTELDELEAGLQSSAGTRGRTCPTARRSCDSTGGSRSGSSTPTAPGSTRSNKSCEGAFAAHFGVTALR